MLRTCSKIGCSQPAAQTLTYVHADACVVVGPLAHEAQPGAHDLCEIHAARIRPPKQWQLIRLETADAAAEPDDLLAIADAVRDAEPPPVTGRTRGHLTIIGDE